MYVCGDRLFASDLLGSKSIKNWINFTSTLGSVQCSNKKLGSVYSDDNTQLAGRNEKRT